MNIDIYIAVTGFLLLLCVFANKLSDRFGIPSLLLFLALGMMAGIDALPFPYCLLLIGDP